MVAAKSRGRGSGCRPEKDNKTKRPRLTLFRFGLFAPGGVPGHESSGRRTTHVHRRLTKTTARQGRAQPRRRKADRPSPVAIPMRPVFAEGGPDGAERSTAENRRAQPPPGGEKTMDTEVYRKQRGTANHAPHERRPFPADFFIVTIRRPSVKYERGNCGHFAQNPGRRGFHIPEGRRKAWFGRAVRRAGNVAKFVHLL